MIPSLEDLVLRKYRSKMSKKDSTLCKRTWRDVTSDRWCRARTVQLVDATLAQIVLGRAAKKTSARCSNSDATSRTEAQHMLSNHSLTHPTKFCGSSLYGIRIAIQRPHLTNYSSVRNSTAVCAFPVYSAFGHHSGLQGGHALSFP